MATLWSTGGNINVFMTTTVECVVDSTCGWVQVLGVVGTASFCVMVGCVAKVLSYWVTPWKLLRFITLRVLHLACRPCI